MTRDQDPEISDAFDELRRSVDPTVDVDTGLDALHATPTAPHRRLPKAALVSAAAVLLLLASIGGAAWWRSSGQTVSADGSDATPSGECEREFIVFLMPHDTAATIDAVDEMIAEQRGTVSSTYLGQEETYDELLEHLAPGGDTDFIESIKTSELPSSFRVRTSPAWTARQIAWIEGIAGVYRVETARTHSCASPRYSHDTPWGPGSGFEPSPTPAGPGEGSGRGPNLTDGTMTSATTGRPATCGSSGQRTRAEAAAGCPSSDVFIVGTVVVDGKQLVVTGSTTLLTCDDTDDSIPISFADVQRLAKEPSTSRPVATWFQHPSGEGWLPVVVVSQLYFGSCG